LVIRCPFMNGAFMSRPLGHGPSLANKY